MKPKKKERQVINLKKFSHTLINDAEKDRASEVAALTKNGAIVPDSLAAPINSGIILGRVTRVKARSNDKGEFLEFNGDFLARVNEVEYSTHKMYLPEVCELDLGSAVANAIAESDQFTGLDFAFEIRKKPNEKSVTGYEWVFEHLLEMQKPDVCAQIMSQIALPALPSPEEEEPAQAQKKKR